MPIILTINEKDREMAGTACDMKLYVTIVASDELVGNDDFLGPGNTSNYHD